MRGHGSDWRGRVDNVVLDAGALFFALSSAGHTEPILVNVLTCVRLPQTACSAGDAPLRFELLHRRAAYPLEALGELRALRPAARAAAARIARVISRAALLALRALVVSFSDLVRATLHDPVCLRACPRAVRSRLRYVLSCCIGAGVRFNHCA